ncbi:MAG: amidohydrolase family protein [Paludibacteraceae bacterium]|nr:amidohydrolase family protein [Paludibacteraceae bacterium]
MKIYRANLIDTPTKDVFRVLKHGYIAVEDTGTIYGTYSDLPDELKSFPVEDLGDQMMIPGFCDMHVHAPQYRNMGLALDLELLPWLNTYTFPEESKFIDLKYAEHIYRRFVHELWMQGTMRSVVFATVHYPATKLLADLLVDSGLSSMVGQVGMNRNCPEYLSNTTETIVQGIRDLDAYLKQKSPDGHVRTIVTPRFVPTCSDEMMRRLGLLAKELNLNVQSHLSENRSEIAWVKELAPESECYGDVYNRFGLFGQQPTLMAHCVHSEGKELEMIKRQNVVVVHCPMSNMNLGSGLAPIRHFLDCGVHVALGTDVSGGHNMSMLRAIQYAIQVSKYYYGISGGKASFLSQSEAFYLATTAGGSFFGKVGCFNPGYAFDALVIDDHYLNYDNYTLEQRLERYFYLGDDRDIKRRFCNGKELCEPKM